MKNDRKFITQKPEPLKNILNADFVCLIAKALKKADANFNEGAFQKNIIDNNWSQKELKQRIRFISSTINEFLPYPYRKQIGIILKVAPAFRGLGALVFPDFIEQFGHSDVEISLEALEILTQYSTGEFAIRPLVSKEQAIVLQQIKKWTKHSNEHVRRLCSEGIRPRLPWATPLPQFKKDPKNVLEILELLKNDSSEYVRRSVANNLNDITKDHPLLVLKTAKRWIGKSQETDKLLRHACRTLLKQGNSEALGIFGFSKNANADITKLKFQNSKLKIGDTLEFSLELNNVSKKSQQLRLEYVIYFLKNNGKHSKKVFQLSSKHFESGTTVFKRTHRFKDFTTRKHYPGTHFIAISINGVEKIKAKIHLTA
ncbi:MAG: DNA alkylation repair protein [Bacteroidetes bacterium]|nr:DNA alkylation repair protein [Bacteroidota bacterium]